MYKHIQWTIFFFEGFGLYARQPRKNLHTGISVNKPKLPVTKYGIYECLTTAILLPLPVTLLVLLVLELR